MTEVIYETIPIKQNGRKVQKWNVFENPPVKAESGSMANQKCYNITVEILRVLTCIVTFVVVLGCAAVSKGTLLFMTSQLRDNSFVAYCNKALDINKNFVTPVPPAEQVSWMWCLLFAFTFPELLVLARSIRMCIFKGWKRLRIAYVLIVVCAETLHTIGVAIMVYAVLPELDVIKGAMLTNCFCIIPSILAFLSQLSKDKKYMVASTLDFLAIVCQLSGLIVWPLVQQKTELWLIPLSVLLISCGWWENYVSKYSSLSFMKSFYNIVDAIKPSRYFIYTFLSIWKIVCFFCVFLIIIQIQKGDVSQLFTMFVEGFGTHDYAIYEVPPSFNLTNPVDIRDAIQPMANTTRQAGNLVTMYVLLIHILVSYVGYIFGKFACKVRLQRLSFAVPLNITIPVTISILVAMSSYRTNDPCVFHGVIPDYLFFARPPVYYFVDFISNQFSWVWILWLLSQTWITIHIWFPNSIRIASTEMLFVLPYYNGLFLDQSLSLNRHRGDQNKTLDEEIIEEDTFVNEVEPRPDPVQTSDRTTKIYVCATMWHENEEEITLFLKSIFRLDKDQFAHATARAEGIEDHDYYEMESHIFFDDAFVRTPPPPQPTKSINFNDYVWTLYDCIDLAASEVHQTTVHIKPPKKYPTPYGGRLEWTLPGQTKLIAHLKDKTKIRNKKRYSQVMYMYYLFGHRLMELPISTERKEERAQNTYILTLDGDIDFQPEAVHKLVDLLKKNENVGAACGRIHPVGSGPMAWYQTFEYAIGHWLQKSTEHVIGCVLCSPGCFSLFRADALMQKNVLAKYATMPKEPQQFVQYDQGEDRWLCTLLLQRGFRIEYSAASDAYTHCPEGFTDLFIQRRRWIPSTVANIMDLLLDYKRTVAINKNISRPYVAYQMLLMAGTVLGPGTIFLMLVGAFTAVFAIDDWTSFIINVVPILIFMLVCFTCPDKVQLWIAALLSAIYELVMMAVLVGILLQIQQDGVLAPSSLFFFGLAGQMIITAFLHPQELHCLPYGFMYYITVPSMYLLLIIYSVFNMNNIKWGTRENATPQTQVQSQAEAQKNEKGKLLGFIPQSFGSSKDEEGSFDISLAGLFRCICCTHKKPDFNEEIAKRLDRIEKMLTQPTVSAPSMRRRSTLSTREPLLSNLNEEPEEDTFISNVNIETTSSMSVEESDGDEFNDIQWIHNKKLQGETDFLSTAEDTFWNELIEEHLKPIITTEEQDAKIAENLKNLRDKAVFAFIMINSLFVLILFLLTLKKDFLHINWPLGIKTNVTYSTVQNEVIITNEYLALEPIGFVFVIFFAVILVIQFIAMLFHRLSTFSQVLAGAEQQGDKYTNQLIENIKSTQMLGDENERHSSSTGPEVIRRRNTVRNLEKVAAREPQVPDLAWAYQRRRQSEMQIAGRRSMSMFEPRKSGILKNSPSRRRRDEERRNTLTNSTISLQSLSNSGRETGNGEESSRELIPVTAL